MNDGNLDAEEPPAVNDEFLEILDVWLDEFRRIRKKEGGIGRPLSDLEENGYQMLCGKRNVIAGSTKNLDESPASRSVNDEFLGRFDVSLDELQRIRKREEETGRSLSDREENGFQMVGGKKERRVGNVVAGSARNTSISDIKLADRDKNFSGKAKVPFHVPIIKKKTRAKYNIFLNQPFEHVWFAPEDGLRFMQLFKLVQDIVPKFPGVKKFTADLEHNRHRSFQGLTGFDTFKLLVHIGPYLREIFKDLKRKKHFCEVTANKVGTERYARGDLLYLYDVIRLELQRMTKDDEHTDSPLLEVVVIKDEDEETGLRKNTQLKMKKKRLGYGKN